MLNYNNICWYLLGPTGIGKTLVSLKIAEKFNNEIINTDAFSLYKEASIMTAKATKKEMSLIKHRMIDILDLFDISYHQKLFKKDALKEINSVFLNSKIPLIVGGTNYFVESILFDYENENGEIIEKSDNHNSIETLEVNDFLKNLKINNKDFLDCIKEIKSKNNNDVDKCYTQINKYLNENFNNNADNRQKDLIKILSVIDPKSSNFYNKNDIRRIINSIAYYISYSKKKSEMLNNQTIKLNSSKNKIIILLPKDIDLLLQRITLRIDQMMQEGFSEIIYIFHKFNLNKKEIDFEHGVLQSIGYKEFYDLYKELNKDLIEEIYINHLKEMNNDDNSEIIKYNKSILNIIDKDEKLKIILENCRQKLINNTINYAKYQIKFIKKRIIPYINGYKIIKIEKYDKETYLNEYIPQIIDYLNNSDYINIVDSIKNKMEDWKRYYCDICKCEINGENDYNSHMKSNKHKKQKEKLRKKEKLNKNNDNKGEINEIKDKIIKMNVSDSQG